MHNPEKIEPAFETTASHPVTDKIVELSPESLEPIVGPAARLAESGLHKAVRFSAETGRVIGSFFVSACSVLLTGEAESQFRNNPHPRD